MNIDTAVPELSVSNVPQAQEYYASKLGFDIAWHNVAGQIGAVCHGKCAIFFRETSGIIHPQTLWLHCTDLEETHRALTTRHATIKTALAKTPWGLWQFTVQDNSGHILHFHNDTD